MALDFTKFKPGATLSCTIAKMPRAAAAVDTLTRMMRLDPTSKKALRRAQRMRRQRMLVYNRGNRDWVSRENPAKVVRVEKGAAWSMPFTLDKVPDLKSIEAYITVK